MIVYISVNMEERDAGNIGFFMLYVLKITAECERMQGFIALHRELLDKPIWKKSTPEQKSVLITLLLLANHEETEWEWQGKKLIVKPGQFVTSLETLSSKSGVSVQSVRTALAKFEKYEFLTNESTKTGRLITITNWDFYQNLKTRTNKETNKDLTKTQQRPNKDLTTNNNDNNETMKQNNNITPPNIPPKPEKKKFGEFQNVKLTDDEYLKLCTDFGQSLTEQAINYLDVFIEEKGYKSKSHYLAIRRWVFDAVKKNRAKPPPNLPRAFASLQEWSEAE